MSDLISRKALMTFPIRKDHYDRVNGSEKFVSGIEAVLEYAANLPAVDAVEVVRCKDCKYRGDAYKCPMYFAHWHCDDEDRTEDEGFCAYGERRKGDENEAD